MTEKTTYHLEDIAYPLNKLLLSLNVGGFVYYLYFVRNENYIDNFPLICLALGITAICITFTANYFNTFFVRNPKYGHAKNWIYWIATIFAIISMFSFWAAVWNIALTV